MNIVLWILQVLLGLTVLAGGSFKIFRFDDLAKVPAAAALPRGGWAALGVLEIACAVLLVVPGALNWMPALTSFAAALLVVESLGLAVLYARYSLDLAATNPLVWVGAIGLVAAFVGYGRYMLAPSL